MLNKIIFTILAIVAIWKVFSLVSKLQKEGGILAKNADRQPSKRAGRGSNEPEAVEMIACPRCGAYIDPRERCSCLTNRT